MYADLLKNTWSKPWVPKLLCGILLLCIVMELVLGLRAFFSKTTVENHSAVIEAAQPVPLDRSVVLKKSFFGDYLSDNIEDADIKKSALHLSVIGIIFSPTQPEDSQVIIKLPDNEERIYHLHDDLPGGARIKQIQPDEIFVTRHGAVESLSLPEKELTFDPPARPL